MKNFLKKVASTAAGFVVLLVGCAMAGLGLTVMAFVALFALGIYGVAMLAAPFVALAKKDEPAFTIPPARQSTPAA